MCVNICDFCVYWLVCILYYSHHAHVVFWFKRNLQHFSPVDHRLHAGCGNSLPGDAMNLVEGVGFQEPLISCPNEHL